jgi:hypothetical protein
VWDPIITEDFVEFFERNEPDGAVQLASMYRSVCYVSEGTLFETKRVKNQGNFTYQVTATSGDTLMLTAKTYAAFLHYIESKNRYPDLDIQDAADYEYSVNKDNS